MSAFLYLCANILKKRMEISLLQTNISWNSPQQNLKRATEMIEQAGKADLYVLPEMFTTGFATQPEGIADSTGEGLQWMKQMARQTDAAIVGSIATDLGGGKYANRMYFVKPDGSVIHYDKHHLFSFGGENLYYTAGQKRMIVEWRGVKFLLMVCYDLRFPLWNRNREEYDCALYVANWPTSRLEAWKTLLKARAIENQCYVCGVNRVGNDSACDYSGGTMFIDPYGRVAGECEEGKESCLTVKLNMLKLQLFRENFPVLKDRDQTL